MRAIKGYYDGENFKAIDNIEVKKNQKVIITLLDEFLPSDKNAYKKYVGKLSDKSYKEIVEALKDCEKVDKNEW